ncbi:hypothetical protein [Qipengyuania spongiae]|uniref:DUF2029 domain-containing protein n=1 Tax=Qipengyuania spongiae TaxID=2909673 RepID=A0ABY5T1K0_9SPHN|nr:hypothetical protein [Qipengyuania spongiae]UVI39384.1 hypothetical protein L1F33_14330 [Qipengyuania spongiae]
MRLLPRGFGWAVLVLVALAGIWNAAALQTRDSAHSADIAERLERGDRVDMDMYRAVQARVAAGEDYYAAVTDEHRRFGFPTSPSVAVRTPVLALTGAWWGAQGWRVIAAILWAANVVAWWRAFAGTANLAERAGAGALAGLFGVIAFMPEIAFSHEALAGLLLSLALGLRQRSWPAALLVVTCAVALRELALPFLLLWSALSVFGKRWREALAVFATIALLLAAFALHAVAVAAASLPGDTVSPGWTGLIGPSLPLYGIHVTTLLQTLPAWLAGPLGVLPLLGWLAIGGRTGTFAAGWFAGFMAFVAIFARQENFYWMALFVPAYGVGLAFVPRAIGDLVRRSAVPTAMS